MSPAAVAVRYQFDETDLPRIICLHAVRQTRCYEDAEDLRQSTVVVALECADSLRDLDRARAWIWGIYERQLMAYIEKRINVRERINAGVYLHRIPASINLERDLIERDSHKKNQLRLQCELQRLKPKERLVLTQFYAAGRPKEEIRAEMNLTDKQFRMLKHRSKARLAEYCLRKTPRMARRDG